MKKVIVILTLAMFFSGCQTMSISPSDSIVIDDSKPILEVIPTIKEGVTTKMELLKLLGEPANMTNMSGTEILTFSKKVGISALFSSRRKIVTLQVFIKDGIVTQFISNEGYQ